MSEAIPLFHSFADVTRFLASTTDYEKLKRWTMKRGEFDLGRVERFFHALRAPQTHYENVHIAGTKGKGSTSMMIDALLRAHGMRTGRYTSPHLERLTERFVVDGQEATESALLDTFRDMATVLGQYQHSGDVLTWFEIMTGCALMLFKKAAVDLAVLETGLGGRLDATNVVTPAITIITNIGHDHHDKLGDTLADIAYEKAGIIKPTIPLITGSYPQEALEVVLAKARELDAPVTRVGKDLLVSNVQATYLGTSFDLRGPHYRYSHLEVSAMGAFQATNAAAAIHGLHLLHHQGLCPQPEEALIREALEGLQLVGRCEFFAGKPDVLLDVSHNEESVNELVKLIKTRFFDRRRVLVFGCADDKDASAMFQLLHEVAHELVLTRYDSPRATDPAILATHWHKYSASAPVINDVPLMALDEARELAGEDGMVIIAGSFYLAGEVRKWL